ncbi:MAG: hypothetical protein ABUT20_56955, partial [Bacteroidota bacterium]
VIDTLIPEEELTNFETNSQVNLKNKGYTFTYSLSEVQQEKSKYFFAEYFLNDSANSRAKLYNMYGYLPSKKRFIQITLFHQGDKDEWVKLIYNIIVCAFYVGHERFYNPYLSATYVNLK